MFDRKQREALAAENAALRARVVKMESALVMIAPMYEAMRQMIEAVNRHSENVVTLAETIAYQGRVQQTLLQFLEGQSEMLPGEHPLAKAAGRAKKAN